MRSWILSFCLIFFSFVGRAEVGNTIPPGVGIPILLFHGIVETYNPALIYTISKKEIRNHLMILKDAGYHTITMEQLYDYYYKQKPLPAKSFMLTFDDGLRTSYYAADDILKELGFTAVMFVIASMPGHNYPAYLSWAELNQMRATGRWEMQAHGYNFHYLIPVNSQGAIGDYGTNLEWLPTKERLETIPEFTDRIRTDLHKMKEIIEENVKGAHVIAFAYPFGDYGIQSLNLDPDLAVAINYKEASAVFPLTFGNVTFTPSEYRFTTTPHLIDRFMDSGSITAEELLRLMEGNR